MNSIEYGRRSQEKHLEARRAQWRNYKRKHPKVRDPQKERCRRAVNNGIKAGTIAKPPVCSACGKGGKIQAHHPDYSKPLEFEWLCTLCHGLRHRTAKIVPRECEDCGEEIARGNSRTRCEKCNRLVCSFCYNHGMHVRKLPNRRRAALAELKKP